MSDKPKDLTPVEELKLVASTMSRKHKRRFLKAHLRTSQTDWQFPDLMKGMSNRNRMMLKKVARGGQETRSRNRRSSRKKI